MALRRDLRGIDPLAAGDVCWWRTKFSEGDGVGFLRWLELCAWTFDPRAPLAERHRPFIPWPIQRCVGRELWLAVDGGHDVLIDKSRDMGASWLCLAVFVWFWTFVEDTPLLAASRKQDYVDQKGNPDSLFWKMRYMIRRQPAFLIPPMGDSDDRTLHLGNPLNDSTIDGESTNTDLARGGRRKAILLDEFGAVHPAEAAAILTATADATPCRIYNSTPQGRAGAFAEVRFSGKTQVITLHWSQHPEKGRKAKEITDADGKTRWTSPWYEAETARRVSRKEIAQELDIDYLASGQAFFDLDVLQRMRASGQLTPPTARGEVAFRVDTEVEGATYTVRDVRWVPEGGQRRLCLWNVSLIDGRPRQDRNYCAFADIGHGMGASNSVLKVMDTSTREVVAQVCSSDMPPHEFARYSVAVCLWFGGERSCLLGWEANGPGGIYGLEVWRCGYPAVLGNADTTIPWRPEDSKIGWYSNRDEKANLLGELRAWMARSEIIDHDEATVAELEQYITYPSGSIGPSSLVAEAEGARKAHGDRVIALAGLCLVSAQMSRAHVREPKPYPAMSQRGRLAEAQREEAARSEW